MQVYAISYDVSAMYVTCIVLSQHLCIPFIFPIFLGSFKLFGSNDERKTVKMFA